MIGYLLDHGRLDALNLRLLLLKRLWRRLHVGTLDAKVHLRVLILLLSLGRAAATGFRALYRLMALPIHRLVLAV